MTPLKENISYGFCHCGCGQKTRIATRNSARDRYVKGEPVMYLPLHYQTVARPPISFGLLDNHAVAFIPLTQGQIAIIDKRDLPIVVKWKWFAHWARNSRQFYAARNTPVVNGARGNVIFMHREIMGLNFDDPTQVDHVNPKATLDNRRCNLRLATPSQNRCNASLRRDNTSGYKGVCFDKKRKRWLASIQSHGKQYSLGLYASAKEAHAAYCKAAIYYHGKFARMK